MYINKIGGKEGNSQFVIKIPVQELRYTNNYQFWRKKKKIKEIGAILFS